MAYTEEKNGNGYVHVSPLNPAPSPGSPLLSQEEVRHPRAMADAFLPSARESRRECHVGHPGPTRLGSAQVGQLVSRPSHPIRQMMKTSCQEDGEGAYELPFNPETLGFSDTHWGTCLGGLR